MTTRTTDGAGTPQYRVAQAAVLLGVTDEAVRRWVRIGWLEARRDTAGRQVIDGAALAAFARDSAHPTPDPSTVARSARNAFVGLVTAVVTDGVMAQVEMQCGPHRVVSLMSTEAVHDLGLEPGLITVAVITSSDVSLEVRATTP